MQSSNVHFLYPIDPQVISVCFPSPHQSSIPSRGSLTIRVNQSRSRAPFHLRVLARPLVPVSVTAFRNACYTISYRIGPRGRISQCTLIRHTIRPVTFTHRGGPVQSRRICSHTLSGDAYASAVRLFVICLVRLGVPECVATGHRMPDPNFLLSVPTILPQETLGSPSIIFTRLIGTPLHTSTVLAQQPGPCIADPPRVLCQ
ncbi:hypothetical protein V8D89_006815 [Ganoderma adspersum]